MISNIDRKVLGQTGGGHFCPVGGFNRKQNQVFVFDTARFKYKPHWVPFGTFAQSMSSLDASTGLPRGFIVCSKKLVKVAEDPVAAFRHNCFYEQFVASVKAANPKT